MIDVNTLHFRKISDEINYLLDEISKLYDSSGKEIVNLNISKYKFSQKSIFNKFYNVFLRYENGFDDYARTINIEKKINERKFKIDTYYYNYIQFFDRLIFSINQEKLSKIKENTIKKHIFKIHKLNRDFLKLLISNFTSEYNDFYLAKNDIEKLILEIKMYMSFILHIAYNSRKYIFIPDYSKLKKFNLENLKSGDIIVFDEFNVKSSFVRKTISTMTNTTLIHSIMFYEKDVRTKKNIFFQNQGINRKKSFLGTLDCEEGIRYLVFRYRKRDKIENFDLLIKQTVLSYLNVDFSLLKIYTSTIQKLNDQIYKNWFPNITYGKNIYLGKGYFCSEILGNIYRDLGIYLSAPEDLAFFVPVAFLNSYEMDLVGYFENV